MPCLFMILIFSKMNNFHNSFALKHGDVQPPFEKDIESMEKTVGSLVMSSIN